MKQFFVFTAETYWQCHSETIYKTRFEWLRNDVECHNFQQKQCVIKFRFVFKLQTRV